ncbi:DNA primase [Microbacterium sp. zg.Y1090]|uniref:DNA primase n=1 Tax=Microbacterium TaxID=33882 RepID=UPI00214BA40F|nr:MULTISPECIES: DNA primase [unclassified Microbacterium]MCR2811792.1 DNA primase [Microbacterium sp. zg.Y1084]MCR2818770.1 DNA primase [Microbacterium sp. zg.Y1090]MDL5486860.1 DNA primase [Microbacterium sp. zg-Y1211]WIM27087.1 DNA primase [Microbacterium sp. zg-Y1090]
MARIRQADVDEVKARTNIADVIGERVALKPAGVGSLKGLCPFHDERSPSFNVRAQAGFYHCFGCGESGDVYTFLRQMDHVSFSEAVERLAGRLGYPLHYEDGAAAPETSGRSRLYAANSAAAEWFRSQLSIPEAEAARSFLGGRGFDAAAAAHFGVGYAPKGWSHLRDALKAKGFSDEEQVAAGLLSQGQRGVYDRFRGRLVWPIRDVTGQVIGFGARKLYDDDQGPKYLNTPETVIYKKSQVLYGLDLAKRDISRQHRVVVVEGYTDVMACHLAGVTTAIATCGTAFGSDHITVLRRVMGDSDVSGEVVFTFDPDAAGQKAALRAFSEEKRFSAQTYVAVAPGGLDPCDLRVQRGDGAVRALLEAKAPMFEFVIEQRLAGYDLATVEGRVGALRAAAPIVADIRDPALRPGYTRVLARKLGLDLSEVAPAVERAARSGAQRHPETPAAPVAAPSADGEAPMPRVTLAGLPRTADVALERDAIMGVLQYGHAVDAAVLDPALALPFHHPALEAVRRAVAEHPDRTRIGWAAAAVESVREPYRTLAAELLTADFPARTEADALASTADLARRLRLRAVEREKTQLLGHIQRVAPDSDGGRAVRLRLRELDAERARLVAE